MKRILPYILIFIIVLQLFAPFTIGNGIKNNLEVRSNKVEAADPVSILVTNAAVADTTATIDLAANASPTDILNPFTSLSLIVNINNIDGTPAKPEKRINIWNPPTINFKQGFVSQTIPYDGLTANTPYKIIATIEGSKDGVTTTLASTEKDITTNTSGQANPISQGTSAVPNNDISGLPVCMNFPAIYIGGCIAQGIYYLFFKTTSLFFALTGKILDFTIKYSIDDTSYRSSFVVEGWGTVRDFCNMFFIFVLLYIAFGTILNLHSVKTKEMIINVVIIGLLINFSLFATQVIIDASNILTRVFYNQKTIVITEKDDNGNTVSKLGDFGEIKLSEAIVSKVDPQQLIIQSQKVNSIAMKNSINGEEQQETGGVTTGSFIIVALLATVVNVVGSIAFLSSALIFIGRVIMLWLAMILAPIAFFSYTIPALQDVKMIGWKKWWPDTLKMAFVAPVFAFFMYIIVGFMDKGLGVVNASLKTGYLGLTFVVSIVVPFAFVMILLMQAKKIAVNMSGELGAALSKAGAAVGGVALGVATGGAAMAMRGTVGRLGNKIATSEWASTHGAVGRTFGNLGKWTGSKSFDARNTKFGAAAGKGMDVDMGKAKEGGYAKHLSDKVDRRQKRAKELEVHENEDLKQNLNKTENDLQSLLVTNAKEIESVDKLIEKKRQEASDAERKLKAAVTPTEKADAQANLKIANNELDDAKNRKTALREGSSYTDLSGVAYNYDVTAKVGTQSIDALEKLQKSQAQDIKTENATRKGKYARAKASWGGRANKEAEHKIIMDAKMDSGTKV